MNSLLEKAKTIIKKPKMLLAVGILGIGLIGLSALFSGKGKNSNDDLQFDTKAYKSEIEKSVKEIVTGITGEHSPTVVVTLENGVRYCYADSGEENNVSTSGTGTAQSSENKKRSYVTVKDSSGGEKALLVTETMPEIRGVAIISEAGDDEIISEKIKNAVKAALNISEKRVYVSGGNSNEKG